jgi:type I site-specific restriction-modification system R (restriction) subunit
MTAIELKYDPFAIKTDLYINGKDASLRCFGTGKDTRLREWIDDFFPEVIKKSNLGPGTECVVQYYGTQSDFEDVSRAYKEYYGQNSGVKIDLPEPKRYPQSLDEVQEIVAAKVKTFQSEQDAKKGELEKVNAALVEWEASDAERKAQNLSELEKKLNEEKERLDKEELENTKKIIDAVEDARREYEILPENPGNEPPIKFYKNTKKSLSPYENRFYLWLGDILTNTDEADTILEKKRKQCRPEIQKALSGFFPAGNDYA